MVKAVIEITDYSNRILNIVKAKYGFKDTSQTIEYIIEKYESVFLEQELHPKYKEKLQRIRKGSYTQYKSVSEVRKKS